MIIYTWKDLINNGCQASNTKSIKQYQMYFYTYDIPTNIAGVCYLRNNTVECLPLKKFYDLPIDLFGVSKKELLLGARKDIQVYQILDLCSL